MFFTLNRPNGFFASNAFKNFSLKPASNGLYSFMYYPSFELLLRMEEKNEDGLPIFNTKTEDGLPILKKKEQSEVTSTSSTTPVSQDGKPSAANLPPITLGDDSRQQTAAIDNTAIPPLHDKSKDINDHIYDARTARAKLNDTKNQLSTVNGDAMYAHNDQTQKLSELYGQYNQVDETEKKKLEPVIKELENQRFAGKSVVVPNALAGPTGTGAMADVGSVGVTGPTDTKGNSVLPPVMQDYTPQSYTGNDGSIPKIKTVADAYKVLSDKSKTADDLLKEAKAQQAAYEVARNERLNLMSLDPKSGFIHGVMLASEMNNRANEIAMGATTGLNSNVVDKKNVERLNDYVDDMKFMQEKAASDKVQNDYETVDVGSEYGLPKIKVPTGITGQGFYNIWNGMIRPIAGSVAVGAAGSLVGAPELGSAYITLDAAHQGFTNALVSKYQELNDKNPNDQDGNYLKAKQYAQQEGISSGLVMAGGMGIMKGVEGLNAIRNAAGEAIGKGLSSFGEEMSATQKSGVQKFFENPPAVKQTYGDIIKHSVGEGAAFAGLEGVKNKYMQGVADKTGVEGPEDSEGVGGLAMLPLIMNSAMYAIGKGKSVVLGNKNPFEKLPQSTKDNIIISAAYHPEDAVEQMLGKGVDNKVITPEQKESLSSEIANTRTALDALPRNLDIETLKKAIPTVLKIQTNDRIASDDTKAQAVRESAEFDNEKLNRKLHEDLGTPLSFDEKQTLGELETRQVEKDEDGKLKKPLTPTERDLMKHLDARNNLVKEKYQAAKDARKANEITAPVVGEVPQTKEGEGITETPATDNTSDTKTIDNANTSERNQATDNQGGDGQIQANGDNTQLPPEGQKESIGDSGSDSVQPDKEKVAADFTVKPEQGVSENQSGENETPPESKGEHGEETPESVPEEAIGTKKAINDALRERLGLKPLELPTRGTPEQGLIKGKELVDSGVRNPLDVVQNLLAHKNDLDNADIRTNDEHVLRYHEMQLREQERSLNKDKIEVQAKLEADPNNADAKGELATINQRLQNNYDLSEQRVNASQIAGKVWSDYGTARQIAVDEQDKVLLATKRIKTAYDGEVPVVVKQQLSDLTQKYNELQAKTDLIEQQSKESEAQHAADKIAAEVAFKKALHEANKKPVAGKKYTAGAKKAADEFRKLKTKPFTFKDSDGKEYTIKSASIGPSWNDAVELGAKAIELSGKIADGVKAAIDHIKETEWYKEIKDKDAFERQLAEHYAPSEKAASTATEGGEKISHSMLHDIVASGITDINDIVKEVKKRTETDASDREIRDAITKYGKTLTLSKDDVEISLRKAKRIGRILSGLEDVRNKKRPLRSGWQRDKLDAEERALGKQLKEEMKDLPMEQADLEKQQKSSLDAVKTRLKNGIEDIEREIETGEKSAKAKGVEYDAEAKELKVEKDRLAKIRDEIFGKSELTDEQKIDAAIKSTQLAIDETQRRIDENELETKKKGKVASPYLESERERLKITKDRLEKMRDDAGITERKKEERLAEHYKKRESELQARLDSKDFAPKVRPTQIKPDRIKKLEKQLAEAKKTALNQDPNLSAADLIRKTASIQKQIDNYTGPKAPIERTAFENNPGWINANKQKLEVRSKLKDLERTALDSKKNMAMRGLDIAQQWSKKGLFLMSQAYQLKMASTTLSALVTKPVEEVAGVGFGKLFPNIAKNAPIESGLNAQSLVKFYTEYFNPKALIKGTRDIAFTKSGETQLEKEHESGPRENHVPGVDLLTTDPHRIIKDPLKRASYESAFIKHMDWYERNGLPIDEHSLIETGKSASYLKAKSEIFMGSGLDKNGKLKNASVIDRINQHFKELEKKGIEEGGVKGTASYGAAQLWSFLNPIVGVPTNILARVWRSNPAIFGKNLLGAAITNRQIEMGVKQLTQNESDIIIRNLKQGSIGTAFWLMGAWGVAATSGGLYSRFKDKQENKDSDTLSVGGYDIPKNAQHSTQLQSYMVGANWSIVYNHYLEKNGDSRPMAFAISVAAQLGNYKDMEPVVSETQKIMEAFTDKRGADKFEKDLQRRVGVDKANKIMVMIGLKDKE